MQSEDSFQNLYEIPNCTICLDELTEDICSLNCGHVFHLGCIATHFQHRGTCPNCQKRATDKQIRMIIYPVTKNTQTAILMRRLVSDMSSDEKQQIQKLFQQYQTTIQKNERYSAQIIQFQKQQDKLKKQVNQTKLTINQSKVGMEQFRRQILQLRQVLDHRLTEIKNLKNQNLDLLIKIQSYKEQQIEYQRIKKYRKLMESKNQQLLKYRKQLECKETPSQEMAKIFFDMTLMKNLDIIKNKQKIEEIVERITQKQQQIKKIKWYLQKQKSQIKQLKQRRNKDQNRIEALKNKYRDILGKYKKLKPIQEQNDIGQDSALSKPQINFKLTQNNKMKAVEEKNLFDFSITQQENIHNLPNNHSLSYIYSRIEEQSPLIQRNLTMKSSSIINELQKIEDQDSRKKKTVPNMFNIMINNANKSSMYSLGSFGGIGRKKKDEKQKKITIKGLFN